jgi:hypothetical protein
MLSYGLAERDPAHYRQLGWVWYVTVQLIQGAATSVGWLLLIPFCLAHAWKPCTSFDVQRTVDCWSWGWLNYVYANPEDGVSGQCALIWVNGETQGPYLPLPTDVTVNGVRHKIAWSTWERWLYEAWRAYCWSALRNSCDMLKYRFAWENGPQATFKGHKLGWWPENGYRVPLL